ncbi:MAG: sigma-70 family RNA polymerase sigma factor [Lachnospiraceae bacterium]|nr:sigma-70 family RNA polymerase sigma factor [Lachnospiraceae bacterium]
MEEAKILHRLKKGDVKALNEIIDIYSNYIQTIIVNIIGGSMSAEDIEEVASDVFYIIWNKAKEIRYGKLKAYISSVARRAALKKLRERNVHISFDDDNFEIINGIRSEEVTENRILQKELESVINKALDELNNDENEIFLRHYYYCQSVGDIATNMGMNRSTVKSKLARGRKKLRRILEDGGYYYENK